MFQLVLHVLRHCSLEPLTPQCKQFCGFFFAPLNLQFTEVRLRHIIQIDLDGLPRVDLCKGLVDSLQALS